MSADSADPGAHYAAAACPSRLERAAEAYREAHAGRERACAALRQSSAAGRFAAQGELALATRRLAGALVALEEAALAAGEHAS